MVRDYPSFGNMPYELWQFNKFLLAFKIDAKRTGTNLTVGNTLTKVRIIELISDPNATNPGANYDQGRAFNEDLNLVERVQGTGNEELAITEKGIEYLELGDWENREMFVRDTRQYETFRNTLDGQNADGESLAELHKYTDRGNATNTGKTISENNFGLNEEQSNFVLREIINDERIAETLIQNVHSKLRYSMLYYMRFIHLEKSHWSPKHVMVYPLEIWTDERIRLFNDVFDISPTTEPRTVRNVLSWSAKYCETLGLVRFHNDASQIQRHNTASLTEKGFRFYQLLELREYCSINGIDMPQNILNPFLGAVPFRDELESVLNL